MFGYDIVVDMIVPVVLNFTCSTPPATTPTVFDAGLYKPVSESFIIDIPGLPNVPDGNNN